jgi:nucleotide sugar dehydrogenase
MLFKNMYIILNIMNIGIIGIGIVGNAILNSLLKKEYHVNINLFLYDKYKNIGNFTDILNTNLLFICLPTNYNKHIKEFDKKEIIDTVSELKINNYNGLIILKSTVEPYTTEILANEYKIDMLHNPEFLTMENANDDFHNQKNIFIGTTKNLNNNKINKLIEFYKSTYPNANVMICKSQETELMKLTENSICAIKLQFLTEIYLLSKNIDINYDNVRNMLIMNNKISPNHTQVPGKDGLYSYGGNCFPKDTNALSSFMENHNVPNSVIKNTINERNKLRN